MPTYSSSSLPAFESYEMQPPSYTTSVQPPEAQRRSRPLPAAAAQTPEALENGSVAVEDYFANGRVRTEPAYGRGLFDAPAATARRPVPALAAVAEHPERLAASESVPWHGADMPTFLPTVPARPSAAARPTSQRSRPSTVKDDLEAGQAGCASGRIVRFAIGFALVCAAGVGIGVGVYKNVHKSGDSDAFSAGATSTTAVASTTAAIASASTSLATVASSTSSALGATATAGPLVMGDYTAQLSYLYGSCATSNLRCKTSSSYDMNFSAADGGANYTLSVNEQQAFNAGSTLGSQVLNFTYTSANYDTNAGTTSSGAPCYGSDVVSALLNLGTTSFSGQMQVESTLLQDCITPDGSTDAAGIGCSCTYEVST